MHISIRSPVGIRDYIRNCIRYLRLLRNAQVRKSTRRLLSDHLGKANLLHAAREPYTRLDVVAVLRHPCVCICEYEDYDHSEYTRAIKGRKTRERAVLCHLL